MLEVDRFDPGKVSSQDEQILLPTTTLPGDYIISLTVVSELDDIRNYRFYKPEGLRL